MEIYEDHFYCFACGAQGPLSLLHKIGVRIEGVLKEPENIKASIERIKKLPVVNVRGLKMHADKDAYYIVWPGGDYYVKRLFNPDAKMKYIAPTGHRRPLFLLPGSRDKSKLILTEGELNAMSLRLVLPDYDIASPGSASAFGQYLQKYTPYRHIHVIVDNDKAGVAALIGMHKKLLQITPYVHYYRLNKDFNDLLQEGTLNEQVKRLAL